MSSAPQGSWFGRNWFWVVPVGCLVPVVVCCGGIGLIFYGVSGALKGSDAYKEAVAQAKDDPALTDILGKPVEPDWWVGGAVQTENDIGTADLMIPLKGPNSQAILHATGNKPAGGKWTFKSMEVQFIQPQHDPINLVK